MVGTGKGTAETAVVVVVVVVDDDSGSLVSGKFVSMVDSNWAPTITPKDRTIIHLNPHIVHHECITESC
jgi:hypothetical protein